MFRDFVRRARILMWYGLDLGRGLKGLSGWAQGAYNPLPDLLRLERGMDTPIGSACDLISIMLRRDSDFGPVAAAFK